MAFTRNRPTAVELLQNSQSLILTNFNDSDTSFGVDHYQFSDTTGNNGKHKDVHIVKRAGDAPNVNGQYTLYSKDYTPDYPGAATDQQFFGITGNGGISQFSGNRTSPDGWCWCGGILIQWGTVTFGSPSSDHRAGTVTFKETLGVRPGCIPFPNACFVVIACLQVASSGEDTASNTISIRDESPTQFRYVFNSSSSNGTARYPGFYWTAIGS